MKRVTCSFCKHDNIQTECIMTAEPGGASICNTCAEVAVELAKRIRRKKICRIADSTPPHHPLTPPDSD